MKAMKSEPDRRTSAGPESEPRAVKVKLRWPVTVAGEKVSSLTMRPPLARDSRDAGRDGGAPADIEIRMYANLCEVAPEAIEALHLGDYLRLQKCFEGFLAAGE